MSTSQTSHLKTIVIGKKAVTLKAKKRSRSRPPTTVQTLIFSKDKFKTSGAAKAWAKRHGYKSSKVDETGKSYRLRQLEPKLFKRDSFRTIALTDGVKAVIGRKREG